MTSRSMILDVIRVMQSKCTDAIRVPSSRLTRGWILPDERAATLGKLEKISIGSYLEMSEFKGANESFKR